MPPRSPSAAVAGVRAAAATGNRRATLEALRDELAEACERVEPLHLAPLAKQLQAVLAELDALPAGGKATVVDELQSRRAKRRAASSGS